MNSTPSANRIHIGFFGKRNSGKSSLINAFTGQHVSIVSDVAGTTTDPVFKAMEVNGIGACTLIDTAGFDDTGDLGEARVEKTKKAADKTDIAIMLFSDTDIQWELRWGNYFKELRTPVIPVVSKADVIENVEDICRIVYEGLSIKPLVVSSVNRQGIDELRNRMTEAISDKYLPCSIVGHLAQDGDSVLLVMPQDIQAPTGRLILPQVQTIRDLLDKKCIVTCVTTDKFEAALKQMSASPSLIITDSQAFDLVYEKKPASSKLTSFSILFAAYKGDLEYYIASTKAVNTLTEHSKVLIAESCTHAPLSEDIGRVKIPAILRKKIGAAITIDIASGTDFPDDLTRYDLIIQCGGCMHNRKSILNRIDSAKRQGVPMTNYGIFLALVSGILDKVSFDTVYDF